MAQDLQRHSGRADISRAVNFLYRFLTCAEETQVNWAKNVLRYLKGTPNMGLVFQSGGDLQLVGAVDANLAGDVNTSKSTRGFTCVQAKSALCLSTANCSPWCVTPRPWQKPTLGRISSRTSSSSADSTMS
jgi:hypothetical protein